MLSQNIAIISDTCALLSSRTTATTPPGGRKFARASCLGILHFRHTGKTAISIGIKYLKTGTLTPRNAFASLDPSAGRLRVLRIALISFALVVASALAASAQAFDHEHRLLDGLLSRHVHEGRVDYEGLASERSTLQDYLTLCSALYGALRSTLTFSLLSAP